MRLKLLGSSCHVVSLQHVSPELIQDKSRKVFSSSGRLKKNEFSRKWTKNFGRGAQVTMLAVVTAAAIHYFMSRDAERAPRPHLPWWYEGSIHGQHLHEGYKGVNWQPSKSLNIYRQPRFREIFNRQMTNWQSFVKREIYSGQKKKKKRLGPTWSDEYMRYQMPKWIRLNFTAYFTDKAIILLILT